MRGVYDLPMGSNMSDSAGFAEVLEAADRLSTDERQELIEILHRRLAEEGRRRVIADVQRSRQEFEAGQCNATSVDDLMHEIQS
jgi:hypothetical protein